MQVGLAGPSGSGKTAFSAKIKSFIPGCALLSMDNYNDGSKVIDGNFDGATLVEAASHCSRGSRCIPKSQGGLDTAPPDRAAPRCLATRHASLCPHGSALPMHQRPPNLPPGTRPTHSPSHPSSHPRSYPPTTHPPTRCCPTDPRITDYDTLLTNIADLKAGRFAQVGRRPDLLGCLAALQRLSSRLQAWLLMAARPRLCVAPHLL